MRLVRFPVIAALALAPVISNGQILVSYAEAPGEYHSTLLYTVSYGFDDRDPGNYSNVDTAVGTYDTITINPVDQYGGAGNPSGSNYVVQGANGVNATELSLNDSVGYFGLWWSAGDNQNVLEFYSDSTLVARFTTDSLLNAITSRGGYNGNPATGSLGGANSGEPYAFVNFFGEENTTWNRIVFSNTSGSGFESDNHTIRDKTWGGYTEEVGKPLPGHLVARVSGTEITVIPEASTAALGALASLGLLIRRRK